MVVKTPTPTPTPTPFVCCGQDSIKFEVGHNVSTQIDTSLGVTLINSYTMVNCILYKQ